MQRNIDNYLADWKTSSSRKSLLIRGARQVGKTYSVRELGRQFKYFLEVNFEEEKKLSAFFQDSLNPESICEKLSLYFSTPIVPGETLLFFDEIQACPEALGSLRFFYEKMPELHVASAGSLLEFTLGEIPSLGVGRIQSLFLYPLSFGEFLTALGEEGLRTASENAAPDRPLADPFHKKLLDYLKIYQYIGGLPAVVRRYLEKKNVAGCMEELTDILVALRDDFAKYKSRSPVGRLREVFDSIVLQAGGKFKYSSVDSSSSSHTLKSALELLVQAGLAYKAHHTSARGLPLGAQVNPKKFKVILFDIGIHQRLLGLDLREYLISNDFEVVNRGHLAEVLVGLELIANAPPASRPALYYWQREARGSNAEVDYVIQRGREIIPIEVKAGTKGQMQSLYRFLRERRLNSGVRISLENFAGYDNIAVIPLYAAGNLTRTAEVTPGG